MLRTRSSWAGLSRHFKSGWRFKVPRPEQGESMRRESATSANSVWMVSVMILGEIDVARAREARCWSWTSFFWSTSMAKMRAAL